jgi:hypothetical protein
MYTDTPSTTPDAATQSTLVTKTLTDYERSTFPRLPLPSLAETMENYLKSLNPWIEEETSAQGTSKDAAIAQRRKWADDFAAGVGGKLHAKLQGKF